MATSIAYGSGATAVSGTWSTGTLASAYDTSATTYATTTASVATHALDITGYGFSSIDSNVTLNSVVVNVQQFVGNASRWNNPTVQAYDGTTAIGSPITLTERTTAGAEDVTITGITLAQVRSANFKIRVSAQQTSTTGSTVFSLGWARVTVNYTPATVSKALSTTWNVAAESLTPVSRTLATSWGVAALVPKTLSTTWNVAAAPVLLKNSFVGISDATAITAGNSGGTSGDAFASVEGSVTAAISADITAAYDRGMIASLDSVIASNVLWDVPSTATGYVRCYLRIPTLASAETRIVRAYDGATGIWGLRVTTLASGSKVVLTNQSGAVVVTTNSGLSAGTIYRIEAKVDGTVAELRVYEGESETSMATTVSGVNFANNIPWTGVKFGATAAAAISGYVHEVAGVAFSNTTWLGPEPAAELTSVSATSSTLWNVAAPTGGGGTAPTFISVESGYSASSGTTITVPRPAAAQDGDIVLVQVLSSGASAVLTSPTGFTNVQADKSNVDYRWVSAWRVVQSGDTSWDWTCAASVLMSYVTVTLRGQDTSSPIYDFGIAEANSTTLTTTTDVGSTPCTLVTFTGSDLSAAMTWTIDSGTERLDETVGTEWLSQAAYTEEISTAGTYNRVLTSSATQDSNAITVAVKGTAGGGTTSVSNALSTSWNTVGRISTSRSTLWNVYASVSAARSTLWNVAGNLTSVSRAVSTSWHVIGVVTKASSTSWNVRSLTTKATSTSWNVRSLVTAARSSLWNVVGRISAARSTLWNVNQSVSASRSTSWHVRSLVSATRSTLWNVAGNLVTVAKAVSTSWHVVGRISSARSTSWHVRSIVGAQRSTSWTVLSRVAAATRATSWHVRELVQNSRAMSWNVLAWVTGTRSTTWNSRAYVDASVASAWHVIETLVKPFTTSWNVYFGLDTPVIAKPRARLGLVQAKATVKQDSRATARIERNAN